MHRPARFRLTLLRLLLLAAACATPPALAQNYSTDDLPDPRRSREWIRGGQDPDEAGFPLLIIHWEPAPDGSYGGYQISGLEGYHSQARVEAFLTAFYSSYKKPGPDVPSLVLCGNNWGSGAMLKPALAALSARLGLSIWRAGGYFTRVHLIEEPEARLAALRAAFAASAPKKPAN